MAKNLDNYRTKINKIDILGIGVDFISLEKALYLVEKWVKTNKQYQITTPNPEHIILSLNNYRFKNVLNSSSLAIADGIGLLWAAEHILKNKKDQQSGLVKVSGVDLMQALCRLAAENKWRVFLLGGREEAAGKAAANLKKEFSGLETAFFAGSSNIVKETEEERKQALEQINKFKPQLLFVAYGAPYQELWIADNLSLLKGVKVAMGVGGSFDYFSGNVKRAPILLQKLGMEWLWRLLLQPWRFQRQLSLLRFVFLVLFVKNSLNQEDK